MRHRTRQIEQMRKLFDEADKDLSKSLSMVT